MPEVEQPELRKPFEAPMGQPETAGRNLPKPRGLRKPRSLRKRRSLPMRP